MRRVQVARDAGLEQALLGPSDAAPAVGVAAARLASAAQVAAADQAVAVVVAAAGETSDAGESVSSFVSTLSSETAPATPVPLLS